MFFDKGKKMAKSAAWWRAVLAEETAKRKREDDGLAEADRLDAEFAIRVQKYGNRPDLAPLLEELRQKSVQSRRLNEVAKRAYVARRHEWEETVAKLRFSSPEAADAFEQAITDTAA